VGRGRAALAEVCSDVRTQRTNLDALLRGFDGVDLSARRHELEAQLAERFTMHTEREAHRKAMGDGAPSAMQPEPPSPEPGVVPQTFDEENLGDNVELF
jgi:hypothetical protein